MPIEKKWECDQSTGMRRKKSREVMRRAKGLNAHREKKEGTHINAHVSVEDWGVNVTSSSLVM